MAKWWKTGAESRSLECTLFNVSWGPIPVVQVSVNPELAMEKQYEIGRAITKLGKEDILVIGSGNKDTPKLLQSFVGYLKMYFMNRT